MFLLTPPPVGNNLGRSLGGARLPDLGSFMEEGVVGAPSATGDAGKSNTADEVGAGDEVDGVGDDGCTSVVWLSDSP